MRRGTAAADPRARTLNRTPPETAGMMPPETHREGRRRARARAAGSARRIPGRIPPTKRTRSQSTVPAGTRRGRESLAGCRSGRGREFGFARTEPWAVLPDPLPNRLPSGGLGGVEHANHKIAEGRLQLLDSHRIGPVGEVEESTVRPPAVRQKPAFPLQPPAKRSARKRRLKRHLHVGKRARSDEFRE